MNWTGGGLQRHRKSNSSAATQRQKSHFARVRASSNIPGSAPRTHHELPQRVYEAPSQATATATTADSIEDQRLALLSQPDWLGLQSKVPAKRKRQETPVESRPFRPLPVSPDVLDDDGLSEVSIRIGHDAVNDRRHSVPVDDKNVEQDRHRAEDAKAIDRDATNNRPRSHETVEDVDHAALHDRHRKRQGSIFEYDNAMSHEEDELYILPTPQRARSALQSSMPDSLPPDIMTRDTKPDPDAAWKAFVFGSDDTDEVDRVDRASSMIANWAE